MLLKKMQVPLQALNNTVVSAILLLGVSRLEKPWMYGSRFTGWGLSVGFWQRVLPIELHDKPLLLWSCSLLEHFNRIKPAL